MKILLYFIIKYSNNNSIYVSFHFTLLHFILLLFAHFKIFKYTLRDKIN